MNSFFNSTGEAIMSVLFLADLCILAWMACEVIKWITDKLERWFGDD